MVRMPSSPRIGAQCFMAGWCMRRPQEADAGLGDAARDGLGRHVELDAERGQHVGGAGQRGDAAVAVLGDLHAGAGRDQRRAGRDVVGAVAVAAGADDVDGVGRHLDAVHAGAQHLRGAGDLLDRLAAHAQRHQEGAHLRRAWRRPPSSGRARCGSRPRSSVAPPRDLLDQLAQFLGGLGVHAAVLRRRGARARTLRRRGREAGELEEVGEQRVAVLGGDALGMELHAVHGMRLVLQAHDQRRRRSRR